MSVPNIYMDFCPSESFSGMEKHPQVPFVAAACMVKATAEAEDEICRFLLPKSTRSREQGPELLRKKLRANTLGLHGLCLIGEKQDMYNDGLVNILSDDEMKPFRGCDRQVILGASRKKAGRIALELNVKPKRVVATAASLVLSYYSVVYFFHQLISHNIPLQGNVKIVIDRIPGEDLTVFNKVNSLLHERRKALEESYGVTVEVKPLEKGEQDPLGVHVADWLAYGTAVMIDHFFSEEYQGKSMTRKEKKIVGWPNCKKDGIERFFDFALKKGYIRHLTPTLLEMMVKDEMARKAITIAQEKYGIQYPEYLQIRKVRF